MVVRFALGSVHVYPLVQPARQLTEQLLRAVRCRWPQCDHVAPVVRQPARAQLHYPVHAGLPRWEVRVPPVEKGAVEVNDGRPHPVPGDRGQAGGRQPKVARVQQPDRFRFEVEHHRAGTVLSGHGPDAELVGRTGRRSYGEAQLLPDRHRDERVLRVPETDNDGRVRTDVERTGQWRRVRQALHVIDVAMGQEEECGPIPDRLVEPIDPDAGQLRHGAREGAHLRGRGCAVYRNVERDE
uniref:Uncharacterized protein n=1 Tax=Anopheles merus TaxID=30066 RepID=A0A182UT02_ANOME